MAAGLTLKTEDLGAFSGHFQKAVESHFQQNPRQSQIYTDGALEPEYFTTEIAELLEAAAPWGQRFPSPLFDNEFHVLQQRVVGKRHLKLRLSTQTRTVDAIAFGQLEEGEVPTNMDRIHAVYRLNINEFRGVRSLQLIIDHIERL